MCRASPAGLLVASDLIARYKIYLLLIPRVHVASSKLVSFLQIKYYIHPPILQFGRGCIFYPFFEKNTPSKLQYWSILLGVVISQYKVCL